jgi:NTE family protein
MEQATERRRDERHSTTGRVREKKRSGPGFAVAFGGGGARGLAHIHVIEVLDELGIRPTAIAGSSIGALMGAAMAAGLTGVEIRDHARASLGRRGEVASRVWKARPGTLGELMTGGLRLGQFDIERILRAFLPDTIPDHFEQLSIPLKVTATDYFNHELAVFETGRLYSALAASAAIPTLFQPVRRDGKVLIDGGIYNPVPFDLVERDADIVIAIDVVGAPSERSRRALKTIDMMFGASQLMMQSIIALKLQIKRPDIFIRPQVARFRVLDFMKVDAVLAETATIRDQLKREIEAAVVQFERRQKG